MGLEIGLAFRTPSSVGLSEGNLIIEVGGAFIIFELITPNCNPPFGGNNQYKIYENLVDFTKMCGIKLECVCELGISGGMLTEDDGVSFRRLF